MNGVDYAIRRLCASPLYHHSAAALNDHSSALPEALRIGKFIGQGGN